MRTLDRFKKPVQVGSNVRWRTYDKTTHTSLYHFGTVSAISEGRNDKVLTVQVVPSWADLVNKVVSTKTETVKARDVSVI